jgi:hypothetical protein
MDQAAPDHEHGRATMAGVLAVVLAVLLCGPVPAPLQAQEQPLVRQWAFASMDQSSLRGADQGPDMALGPPDSDVCSYAGMKAWTSWRPDSGLEWIQLRYEQPVFAVGAIVHEALNPGAVSRVCLIGLDGSLREVWRGRDTVSTCPGAMALVFPASSVPVHGVRVELQTDRVAGFNAIDAVELVGYPTDEPAPAVFSGTAAVGANAWRDVLPTLATDLDNDGWPDIIALAIGPAARSPFVLLHNEGDGRFVDRSALLASWGMYSTAGAKAADIDNDGDVDLLLTGGSLFGGQTPPDVLLASDRGTFARVAAVDELGDSLNTTTAMWWDYDADGWIDLYVGRGVFEGTTAAPNGLYRNLGGRGWANTTRAAGLEVDFHRPGSPYTLGTLAGSVAADLNGDGFPDLFVPVGLSSSRLFVSRGDGTFADQADPSLYLLSNKQGVVAGDIDNDGNLDIIQTGFRDDVSSDSHVSSLLHNLGSGAFVDVTGSAGLSRTVDSYFPSLGDVDNDGDLDLLLLSPAELYLNRGDGSFVEATSRFGAPGAFTLADLDGDGSVDLATANGPYLNRGNGHHSLRVLLTGTASNRSAIGTRLCLRAAGSLQTRELGGGNGDMQDELVVHFGLGQATQVDELEIRWPSGQVDVLRDLPVDQEVRVIEGRGTWYPAPRSVWTLPPPQRVAYGQQVTLAAVCRPTLFEPSARITQITGDLSGLGGPVAVPLVDQGHGTYRLEWTFTVGGSDPLRDVEIKVQQETSLGAYWINLSRNVEVLGDPLATAVRQLDAGVRPSGMALSPNWPNPFNGVTTIAYSLPVAGAVDLTIYDLVGQQVITLVAEVCEAGPHRVQWDGRDAQGVAVASGVYVYRLAVPGIGATTRRLLLLR